MEDKIIAYKGMDSNMQCRGMQYEVGKEFSVDGKIECCGNGLHACERPLDVLGYYRRERARATSAWNSPATWRASAAATAKSRPVRSAW